MDQESIVYGCIKDSVFAEQDSLRKQTNRKAILSLLKADDWPYLSQEMFSAPGAQSGSDAFHTDVIHFGASYKAIEYEWDQWLSKFELLLNQMYWVSAVVHLETELAGVHTFTWETAGEGHIPGDSPLKAQRKWSRESVFS